jgi:hypothetical protein
MSTGTELNPDPNAASGGLRNFIAGAIFLALVINTLVIRNLNSSITRDYQRVKESTRRIQDIERQQKQRLDRQLNW